MEDLVENNTEKVKQTQLEMFDTFIDICNKYGLRWCCGYGTLLGAVRDGGMIAWDHDVDVWMPYSDFNKLFELHNTEGILSKDIYLSKYNGKNYYTVIGKLKKRGTTGICMKRICSECNIFIDIYPIFDLNINETGLKINEACFLSFFICYQTS